MKTIINHIYDNMMSLEQAERYLTANKIAYKIKLLDEGAYIKVGKVRIEFDDCFDVIQPDEEED